MPGFLLYAPPWFAASLLANLAIAVIEYIQRAGKFPTFWAAVPFLFFPVLTAQWALFHSFRGAPSMLVAWGFFSACNAALRVASTRYVIGEPVCMQMLAGVAIMILGAYVIQAAPR
jgi:hypothetical protein